MTPTEGKLATTLQTQRSDLRERILDAVGRAPSTLSFGQIQEQLRIPPRTLQRHLQALVAAGKVERVGRGLYRHGGRQAPLGAGARRIVRLLKRYEADAHLTGFDLLVPYAHQFAYEFPHVVYCAPAQNDSLRWQLANSKLSVTTAGAGANYSVPDQDRLVVLRSQPNAERYRVHGHLAAPEKAWVDQLREISRSRFPIGYEEMGRILGAMTRTGADMRWLRFYAGQLGYLDWVAAALDTPPAPADPIEMRALRSGYLAV